MCGVVEVPLNETLSYVEEEAFPVIDKERYVMSVEFEKGDMEGTDVEFWMPIISRPKMFASMIRFDLCQCVLFIHESANPSCPF